MGDPKEGKRKLAVSTHFHFILSWCSFCSFNSLQEVILIIIRGGVNSIFFSKCQKMTGRRKLKVEKVHNEKCAKSHVENVR